MVYFDFLAIGLFINHIKGVVMGCCHKGLTDWYLQRGTTVFISAYFMPMIVYWLINPHADTLQWHQFMTTLPMLLVGVLGVTALGVHAYIGMWVVFTDYLSDYLGKQSCCGHIPLFRRIMTGLMGGWVFGSVAVALVLMIGWGIL